MARAVSMLSTINAENREKLKKAGAWTAFVEGLGSEGKSNQEIAEQVLAYK